MKRLATFACLVVLSLSANLYAECKKCHCEPEYLDLYIGAGYRRDHYNLSDTGRTFFLSDTFQKEWKNMELVPFFGKVQYRHPCNFYANVYVSYAKAYDGEYKQTGSITVGSTVTVHDIIRGIASKQEAFDASGALGWQFHFLCDFFTFTPMVGYANYQQNYWAEKLEIDLGNLGFDFDPCDATQNLHAYWRGPWVGFSTTSGPYWCNWYLNWGWDFTWVFYTDRSRELYESAADTGTSHDLAYTIKNRSHGTGNHAWLGVEYKCEPTWSVGIFSDWRWFNASSGPSRFKLSLPVEPFEICGEGRFTGAHWNSWNIYVMLGWHWF